MSDTHFAFQTIKYDPSVFSVMSCYSPIMSITINKYLFVVYRNGNRPVCKTRAEMGTEICIKPN